MSTLLPVSRRIAFALGALAALALTASCHESSSSPTSPAGTAAVSGTVILGAGTSGATAQGMEIGLSGVTVRVVQNGQSAMTDSSGTFMLNGVPAGMVDMEFTRADINARAPVVLVSGTNSITAAVHGSTAVITPRGHAGEEIEGLVQSNAGGGTIVVLDQRLGAVTVKTNTSTLIRRGNTVISLSQIQTGMRVHVKAMLQGDGTYLSTEILLQDDNVGGEREVEGTVASVDTGAKSFVVTTVSGAITVKTGGSTTFRKKGSSATFSDVAMGAIVEVEGTLQSDGSILARTVTIE